MLSFAALAGTSCFAQTEAMLDAPTVKATAAELPASATPATKPDAPPLIVPVKPAPKAAAPAHTFFDVKNGILLGTSAAGLIGDSLSTQRALPFGHEVNPIARPFVQSRAGAAAYGLAGYGMLAGGMYFAHRRGWHRLERVVPMVFTVTEGLLTYNNYHVVRK